MWIRLGAELQIGPTSRHTHSCIVVSIGISMYTSISISIGSSIGISINQPRFEPARLGLAFTLPETCRTLVSANKSGGDVQAA